MLFRQKKTDRHPTRAALWQKRLRREAHDPRAAATGDGVRVKALRYGLQAIGLYRRGVANALSPMLNRVTFHLPILPLEFDGFRILHLSDFHFPGPPGFSEALRNLLDDPDCARCDLCALTGDFAFNRRTPHAPVADELARLLASISPRHGIVAVPGNNDSSKLIEAIRSKGYRMLINENMQLGLGGAHIYVAGVDDPHEFCSAGVLDAICGIPEGAFTLFLAHSPEAAAPAARAGAHLYLCGHTHGGQICLPGRFPPFINARCPRSRAAGAWRIGTMQGYTTRGLGASTIEIRYNCPPDATLITLKNR